MGTPWLWIVSKRLQLLLQRFDKRRTTADELKSRKSTPSHRDPQVLDQGDPTAAFDTKEDRIKVLVRKQKIVSSTAYTGLMKLIGSEVKTPGSFRF